MSDLIEGRMVSPFLMVVSVVGVFAEKWRTWRESNPRPLASEANTLSN